MKKILKHILPLLLIVLIAACNGDNKGVSELAKTDNSNQIVGGGTFFPNVNGHDDHCQRTDGGDCEEPIDMADIVVIGTTQLEFGLNETDYVECITVANPGSLSFSAEIDKPNTDYYATTGNYQFAIKTSSGAYSQDRVEGTGDIEICYLREEVREHRGQIKIAYNIYSESSAYAYMMVVSGQTMPKVFSIHNPTPMEIIDERSGHNDGRDDEEGDFLKNSSGTVNLDLVDIFENGHDTEILINSAGVKYRTGFDASGNFNKTIGLPQSQGVYNVSFSLKNKKGQTIQKDIPVVVAGKPSLDLELRDIAGNMVDSTLPTNAANLILGFKVSNLPSSGSSETEMPVTIKNIQLNGSSFSSSKDIHYDAEASWCLNDEDQDYAGFDPALTYCLSLDLFEDLQMGVNTITATAANALGETTSELHFIVSKNQPQITLYSPKEQQLFDPSTNTLTIKGFVRNFAPVDVSALNSIPAIANESDAGSYCQPSSNDDSSCPASSIKLWINTSTSDKNFPIYIYPQTNYYTDGVSDNNSNLQEGEVTTGNCDETTTEEILFDGDTDNTEHKSDGSIVTTLTDEDGNITTYTTDVDGNITITHPDGTVEETVSVTEEDHLSNNIQVSDNGNVSSEIYNKTTDVTVSTSTNPRTGQITQTTHQRLCNIPQGRFNLTFTLPNSEHHGELNLYTNIIQMQAENIKGHRTIDVRTFALGHTNPHELKSSGSHPSIKDLYTGQMGSINMDCPETGEACVIRSPVMLNLSEGLVKDCSSRDDDCDPNDPGHNVVRAVEYILNKNLSFADLANGWPHPENSFNQEDLLADFKRRYKEETDRRYTFDDFANVDRSWQKKLIWHLIHQQNMAQKFLGLRYLRAYRMLHDDMPIGQCSITDAPETCFFENEGNQFDSRYGFAVAKDACDEEITTSFLPLSDFKDVAEAYTGVTSTIDYEAEMPTIATGMNGEFNDFVQGRWKVDSLNLKNNGYVDADLCLIPKDAEIDSCADDISNARTPAFWGHFVAYDLIKGGLLQGVEIDDATMPLIWSVGKVRLKLENIIQIKKTTIRGGSDWTNKIDINLSPTKPEPVDVNIVDMEHNHRVNSIIIEPFGNCDGYYKDLYNEHRSRLRRQGYNIPAYNRADHLPFGCNPNYSNRQANFPFILDRTSTTGQDLYNKLNGSTMLLEVVWQGVTDTFKKIVGCMDKELVNPIINPKVFKYPDWVWKEDPDAITTTFDWEGYLFEAVVNHADLDVYHGGITARLPLKVGAEDVETTTTGVQDFEGMENIMIAGRFGHLMRSKDESNLGTDYPLTSADPQKEAFAGISLNIEEVLNGALYTIFKKGPMSLLDTFDVNEMEPEGGFKVGVDKVIMGRFDICNLANLIDTSFQPNFFFTSVQSLFDSDVLHFDLILDPNYPPTISMGEADGTNKSTELKIALTNVQIAVKNMYVSRDAESGELINEGKVFDNPKDNPEVFRLRLDAVLSAKTIYHKSQRKFLLFIEGYEKQNIHLSIVPGHGGPTYDDVNVVTDTLTAVVQALLDKVSKDFDPDVNTEDYTASITFTDNLTNTAQGQFSAVGLNDLEIEFNVDASENEECGDDVPLYYNEFINGTTWDQEDPNDDDADDEEDDSDTTNGIDGTQSRYNNSEIGSDFYCDAISRTWERNDDGEREEIENIILESLCDFGIEDVIIKPDVQFDNTNGYLHLSTEVEVKTYEWAK